LLRFCNTNKIGVVPQGGNTGLVGGGIGIGDQMILSLNKMSKVIRFDDSTGIITVEGMHSVHLQIFSHSINIF
jgi:FAD/FMN-containing dehydrogenase